MSYTHFTLEERESLSNLLAAGKNYSQIARELGRHRSTIKREVERNYSKKKQRYHPWRATVLYIIRRKNCRRKPAIAEGMPTYDYVKPRLEMFWPPEVIADRAKEDGISISCSTIYRAVKNGVFEGVSPKTNFRRKGKNSNYSHENSNVIHPTHTIHERPEIVELKGRSGDWEGDTVYGAVGKGCLVTLVDRRSKLLLATRCKSRNSEVIRTAFKNAFKLSGIAPPVETITLDNGAEFAAFKDIEKDLNAVIYFADSHSPWQRGLSENTNDLIRFFFPKGTDFLAVTDEEVQRVVDLINSRPRKCLDFLSPLEFLACKCCT